MGETKFGRAYGIQLEIKSLNYKIKKLPKFLYLDFVEQEYQDKVADLRGSYKFQIEELSQRLKEILREI